MKNDSIEFLKKHCEFNEPTDCYILIAVSRKKDTEEMTASKEIAFRDVIKDREEIEKKYLKIKSSILNYRDINGKSYPFYLYISLNPRNGRKATIELSKRIFDWFEKEPRDKDILTRYKQTYAEFYSCLALPECRGSKKYFMIDLDTKDLNVFSSKLNNMKIISFMGIPVVDSIETRHGYHLKLEPFDRRTLPDTKYSTLKTDGLFFVEYVKND